MKTSSSNNYKSKSKFNNANNDNEYYHQDHTYLNNSKNTYKQANQKRHNLSNSKMSQKSYAFLNANNLQNRTRFQDRIQKACDTYAPQEVKKQLNLMKKQIQRLEKQNLKKDKKMLQMQSSHSIIRQLQAEIQQAYRLVYFYQGKIFQLENQLKRLQKKIANNIERVISPQQIEGLLFQYRNDNGDLRGTIQEQNRVISVLEDQIKQLQTKYFSTSWKLSTKNRVLANPLKKKFPNLRQNIILKQMPLLQKEKIKLEMNEKFGQTQKKIVDVQNENKRLKNELSVSKTKASINMGSMNNGNKTTTITMNSFNNTNSNSRSNQQNILSSSSYAYNSNNNSSSNWQSSLPPEPPTNYNSHNYINNNSSTSLTNRNGYITANGNGYALESSSSRQQSPRIIHTTLRESPRQVQRQNSSSSQRQSLSSYHRVSHQSRQSQGDHQGFKTPYHPKIRTIQIQ